jgi:nitroimidazol reductase NimA-like FMN-containing flavoprotein (pyridoxamine 5'-phosphate oxidase superfamily)
VTVTPTVKPINRHADRALLTRADLDDVLDAGHRVGSLCSVMDGRPWVVPMLYARVGDRILMHGSTGAGLLRHVTSEVPAALCVTHMDGWVYAHTLFDSSANYRSAVVHGALTLLTGDEAVEALVEISDRLTPGRAAEVPVNTKKQVAATRVLAMGIAEGGWTVKVRDGDPGEPDADELGSELWTGVLPIVSTYRAPKGAARLPSGIPVSASVLNMLRHSPYPPV